MKAESKDAIRSENEQLRRKLSLSNELLASEIEQGFRAKGFDTMKSIELSKKRVDEFMDLVA